MKKLALFLCLVGCTPTSGVVTSQLGAVKMANWNRVHDLLNGFPTAVSGTAWFYLPGTTTPLIIAGDSTGTAITNPVTLNSNGAATVYLSQLARMIVQTNAGATVVDTVINGDSDTTISTTSTAFSGTTLKDNEDAALIAFGGQDYYYVPSGSWVGMTPRNWMNGVMRNVMAYGSVGATQINDGVTPADTAIAAAIADVQASGGGVVYFPPGNYLLNSPIAIPSGGIELRGAGSPVTRLTPNSGTNSGVTYASAATGVIIRGLTIQPSSTSTGDGLSFTSAVNVIISDVILKYFDVCMRVAGGTQFDISGNSYFLANLGNVGARAIKATALHGLTVEGGSYGGNEYDIEFLTTTTAVTVSGATSLGSNFFFRFDAALNSAGYFTFMGCNTIGIMYSFGAATMPKYLRDMSNGGDGYAGTLLSGGTFTPNLAQGRNFLIDCTTTGSANTVAVPTPSPPATDYGVFITITYWAHAGGNLTAGSAFAAGYHLSAQPTLTDTHKTTYLLHWEPDNSIWREVSRSDTT